jgi:hypothetical protein
LRYQARSRSIAHREGHELVVPLSDTVTLASQLAPLPQRTLPVVLPAYLAPRRDVRTLTIVAPNGFDFAELPPGGAENGGEFGKAILDIAPGETGSVVVKRTVIFDLSTIPPRQISKMAHLATTRRCPHAPDRTPRARKNDRRNLTRQVLSSLKNDTTRNP